MPQTPYAKLLISVAGGAAASGGQTAATGATLAFSFESTAGWGSNPVARTEIYAFPDGFTAPSGWSTDATTGAIYVLGNTAPPGFTLSADADDWAKYLFRLTVDGGLRNGVADATLVDTACAIDVLSPSGLHDLAAGESTQFSSSKAWVAHQQENLRTIESGLAGGLLTYASVKTALAAADSAADLNDQALTGVASVTTPTVNTTAALALGESATSVTIGAAGVATSLPGNVTAGTLTIGTKRVDPYNVNATAKTADYTAALGDLVRCDPSSAGFTVTLPSAASNAGRGVTIKNVTSSTNAITIEPDGSETIDDETSYSVSGAYANATLVSDGTNWMAFPPAA